MEKILFFFLAFPSLLLGASTNYQSIEENETHSTALHSLANCNSKDRPFYGDLCAYFYRLHLSGLDLDTKDQSGNTPLMYAVMNGFCQLIELLVNEGADTTLRNKEGKTAWHFMREMKRDSTEKYAIRDILNKYPKNKFEKNAQNFFRKMFSCVQKKLIVRPLAFYLNKNSDSSRENSRDSF